MKKRILFGALLMIALCCGLIAGSTFALFTSEATVSIAVTSGTVEVIADLDSFETWSLEDDKTLPGRTDLTFSQGGKVTYDSSILTLDKMIPGDKLSFDIAGQNKSNINIKYRYIIENIDGIYLMNALALTIDGVEYKSLMSYTSEWFDLAAEEDIPTVDISIELPAEAGNDYQDLKTKIIVKLEAIQGNVTTEGDETVKYLNVSVTDETSLKNALSDGGFIKLENDIDCVTGEALVVPEGKTVYLDLNGKKLTNKVAGIESSEGLTGSVVNNGTLYIEGNGAVVNGTGDVKRSHTIVNNGQLVIESGNIGSDETAGAAVLNQGIATINGGTFASKQEDVKSDGLCAYAFINNSGTMTINNATLDSETHGVFGAYDGEIIVNGGSYNLQGNNGLGCYLIYATGNAKVTLNDGEFSLVTPRNNRYFFVYDNGNYFNENAVNTDLISVAAGVEIIVDGVVIYTGQ